MIELAAEIWELRDTLTAYDAAYLVLARRLDVGLVTLDGGLATIAARDGRLVQLETGLQRQTSQTGGQPILEGVQNVLLTVRGN